MDRRLYIPLVAAAAVLVAGVGRPSWTQPAPGAGLTADVAPAAARHPGHAPHGERARRAAAPRHRLVPDTVDAELAVWSDGEAARFALAVVNTADRRVELDFADGRTRDFAVYDAEGREVWRWSRGRMFTQVMQNKLLPARDSAVYAESWKSPRPGRYTVVAELKSANHPIRRAAAFVVPAPIPAGAVAAAPGAGPAPATP